MFEGKREGHPHLAQQVCGGDNDTEVAEELSVSISMSAPMPADRSFQLIEAVADRFEGAPAARRRRWSDAWSSR